MWGSRVFRAVQGTAAPLVVAAGCGSSFGGNSGCHSSRCSRGAADDGITNKTDKQSADERLLKRATTLQHAAAAAKIPVRRSHTAHELGKLRSQQTEMMQRWERDEGGWRELPARAWPPYQPNERQMQGIRAEATTQGCFQQTSATNTAAAAAAGVATTTTSSACHELLFNIATTLVFYNVNAQAGFSQYEALAKEGHVDSMVACGVILVEGLGIPPREQEGIEWLKKAVDLNSSQASYELGTVYYTGIDGLLPEDPVLAFQLFQRAAEQDQHTAALFMMADCLVEGEGTDIDVARAVPLFYQAAERGHRYARQRIRELLASHV